MDTDARENTAKYAVGNLTYHSTASLLTAMALVVLGVFVYSISIAFVPKIIPIRLRALGTSNTLLVFIMSTLPQILNMTVCPWVSFKSDRFRSRRWGRRFPFIFYTMPMMCTAWLLLAFVDSESAFLFRHLPSLKRILPVLSGFEISQTGITVILLAAIVVFYYFFYMFVGSVIYYVYNDVIPARFMTRFMGVLQICGTLSASFFSFFIFKNALSHFRSILIGISIVYAVAISAMCLLVREPRFPAPDETERRQSRGIRAMLTFMRESFSHRFYWYAFGATAATAIGGATSMFVVFHEKSMGMDMGQIGIYSGTSSLIGTCLVFAIASLGTPFIDRWHPVRVTIFCTLFGLMGTIMDCKWIFFTPPVRVYFWGALLISQVTFLFRFRAIANMPALMRLYPKSRFGQFCSAQSMFRSLAVLGFSLLLGRLMDYLMKTLGLGDYAYRFIFVWVLVFNLIAVVCYLLMYREFLRLGGYTGYKAPAPWTEGGLEPMPVTEGAPASRLLTRISGAVLVAVIVAALGWTLFMPAYARYALSAPDMSARYLTYDLPVAIVLLAAYLVWGLHVFRADRTRIPHHSMLILSAIMSVLLMGAYAVENMLAARLAPGMLAPNMWLYELISFGVLLLMLAGYTAIENRTASAASEENSNAPEQGS